ncbi:MAG TPA: AbrB/MazE/SpoVT family DNA-binding domain-containing protein [Firmicutes bacterium]|nr:AbrB/MazE/SpoVT family DNA-binding domain-containing protein [Bacillota bacterium]
MIYNKRKIDDEYRIAIPLGMRDALHIGYKDPVVWEREDDKIIISSGGKAMRLTGVISTRVDDVGKVPLPRFAIEAGLKPGMEVELACDGDCITFEIPKE